MLDFKDKVAIVTGGASGIGKGCALAFAGEGAHIVIADVNDGRAQETIFEVKALGVEAFAIQCDVSSDADIDKLRSATLERFGKLNILMNNVGSLPVGRFEDVPLSEWERCFQINVFSYVRAMQKLLPDIIAAGEGHLINTASLAGYLAYDPMSLTYAASKAAVVSLTEGIALDLLPKNIGVTCLSPGPVATNIGEQARMFSEDVEVGRFPSQYFPSHTPEEVGAQIVAAIRENRFLVQTNPEADAYVARRGEDADGFLAELLEYYSPPS